MTAEHLAFRRAIVANPRDLLARLVFADYLEETGDPNHVARAHLIRAQIALDDPATDAEEFDRLQAFETRLLDLFREEWDRELPMWLLEEGAAVYLNGFVEHVQLSFTRFFRSANELFDAVPLRSIQLVPPSPRPETIVGQFDRLPRLSQIQSLKLGPDANELTYIPIQWDIFESPLFTEVMRCRTLTGVRTLDLARNRIDDRWLTAFAAVLPMSAFGGTLEVLNLSDSYHLTDAGGDTLATAAGLSGLKRLILTDVPFTSATRSRLRRAFGDRVRF